MSRLMKFWCLPETFGAKLFLEGWLVLDLGDWCSRTDKECRKSRCGLNSLRFRRMPPLDLPWDEEEPESVPSEGILWTATICIISFSGNFELKYLSPSSFREPELATETASLPETDEMTNSPLPAQAEEDPTDFSPFFVDFLTKCVEQRSPSTPSFRSAW